MTDNTKIKARFPAYFNMDYQGCDYADIEDLKEMLTDVERLTAVVKDHGLSEARIYGGAEFEDQDGMTRFINCELVVDADGAYFQDCPKHGDGMAETRGIKVGDLREIVAYCEANNITEADFTAHSEDEFEGYAAWLDNPVTHIPSDEDDDDLIPTGGQTPSPGM